MLVLSPLLTAGHENGADRGWSQQMGGWPGPSPNPEASGEGEQARPRRCGGEQDQMQAGVPGHPSLSFLMGYRYRCRYIHTHTNINFRVQAGYQGCPTFKQQGVACPGMHQQGLHVTQAKLSCAIVPLPSPPPFHRPHLSICPKRAQAYASCCLLISE